MGERFRSLRTINVGSSIKSELRQSGWQAKFSSTPLTCTLDETVSGSGEGPPVVSRIASFCSVISNARFFLKQSRSLQTRQPLLRKIENFQVDCAHFTSHSQFGKIFRKKASQTRIYVTLIIYYVITTY